ncbi:MAG TPA: hypothetical protein VLM38_11815, partial [Blastocatellia bacterium]|nr:hypothetical protein [Blastocatellia bacterium]
MERSNAANQTKMGCVARSGDVCADYVAGPIRDEVRDAIRVQRKSAFNCRRRQSSQQQDNGYHQYSNLQT